MAAAKQIVVHLISSSHWDREWYRTVEDFRFRLVQCMNRVLDYLRHDPEWVRD